MTPSPQTLLHVRTGQILVSRRGSLKALLGSCVGIAIFSANFQLTGVAHCLLPTAPLRVSDTAAGLFAARFCNEAITNLVHAMRAAGSAKTGLSAVVCGGASLLSQPGGSLQSRIGEQNLAACRLALSASSIRFIEVETGGNRACAMTVDCSLQSVRCYRVPVLAWGKEIAA